MNDKVAKTLSSHILSNIIPYLIAVVGFSSSVVTMFVDVNTQLSIKWLLFSLVISITAISILIKIIYDLLRVSIPAQPVEHPIKYVQDQGVFIIRRNENFLNTIIVGCYVQNDDIERLAYLGTVHLVQDKVIQIKVQRDYGIFTEPPLSSEQLKSIAVRSVVPVEALEQFQNLEN